MLNTCLSYSLFHLDIVREYNPTYDIIPPFIFAYHQTIEGKKEFAVKLKQARMRVVRGKITHTLEKNIECAA